MTAELKQKLILAGLDAEVRIVEERERQEALLQSDQPDEWYDELDDKLDDDWQIAEPDVPTTKLQCVPVDAFTEIQQLAKLGQYFLDNYDNPM